MPTTSHAHEMRIWISYSIAHLFQLSNSQVRSSGVRGGTALSGHHL